MNVDELMQRAWEAVRKSGVPEPLQPVALKEAVDFLREQEGDLEGAGDSGQESSGRRQTSRARAGRKSASTGKGSAGRGAVETPDESTFFSRLADESGVDEQDLRDVLRLDRDGTILVSPATKNLGTSKAEQSRSVIALVGGARAFGLQEDPVDAEAVRTETKRKRCFMQKHFAERSLGPMKGFNSGSHRNEIVLTSKWVDEFKTAVEKGLGRKAAKEETG